MPDSITLSIPIHDGTTQTVEAIRATPHFAIHPALDQVIFAKINSSPWAITHIPSLCRLVFSDSQMHAAQVAGVIEKLPVDWDLPKCIDDVTRESRRLIVEACRIMSKLGLCWSEWV